VRILPPGASFPDKPEIRTQSELAAEPRKETGTEAIEEESEEIEEDADTAKA
jgi:hypothetical protein